MHIEMHPGGHDTRNVRLFIKMSSLCKYQETVCQEVSVFYKTTELAAVPVICPYSYENGIAVPGICLCRRENGIGSAVICLHRHGNGIGSAGHLFA